VAKDLVLNSVNNEHADRCVDFIVRADGSYGYKQYRRDVEDNGAWFVIASFDDDVFVRYEDAVDSAVKNVAWLSEAMERAPRFTP
jgi:hypothetical protein